MSRSIDPTARADVLAQEDAFVRRLARSLAWTDADADDAVQSAHLAALESQDPATVPTRSWLAFVIRRLIAHTRRSVVRRATHEQADARPVIPRIL